MKAVVGYIVGFACAALAALGALAVFLPVAALPFKRSKQLAMLLGSVVGGFAAAWTGDGILRLFDLRAGWPFFAVLVIVFLAIEAGHASARRLSLPVAAIAQIAGLIAGWLTLPK